MKDEPAAGPDRVTDNAPRAPLPHSWNLWLILLCIALGGATILFCGKGFYYLVFKPGMPNDMHLRWVETQYILAGRNPNDVFFASPDGAAMAKPLWNARNTSEIARIGPVGNAGYPPWGFFGGIPFYWPAGEHLARDYFAALNLIALGLLFAIGYQVGCPHGKLAGLTLGLSCLAVSSNSTTLSLGQYGVVINALLGVTLLSLPKRRFWAAGTSIGLAFSKPISSGPFGLVLLVARHRKALLPLIAYMVIADAAIWAITKTNPLEMVQQMLRAGQGYMQDSYGPMTLLMACGVSQGAAEALSAGVGVVAAFVLISLWAKAPALVHFAIASVAARFWSYHKLYDNLIVTFLLLACGQLALRKPTRLNIAVFALMGFSLWPPGKLCDHRSYQLFQFAIWVVALAVLLAGTSRDSSSSREPAAE